MKTMFALGVIGMSGIFFCLLAVIIIGLRKQGYFPNNSVDWIIAVIYWALVGGLLYKGLKE